MKMTGLTVLILVFFNTKEKCIYLHPSQITQCIFCSPRCPLSFPPEIDPSHSCPHAQAVGAQSSPISSVLPSLSVPSSAGSALSPAHGQMGSGELGGPYGISADWHRTATTSQTQLQHPAVWETPALPTKLPLTVTTPNQVSLMILIT